MNLTVMRQHIFYSILEMVNKVYVTVKYSDDTQLPWSKDNIDSGETVLVFNDNNHKDLEWNQIYMSVILSFGSGPFNCVIPAKNIVNIYSPELNVSFSCHDPFEDSKIIEVKKKAKCKIVTIDFKKRLCP